MEREGRKMNYDDALRRAKELHDAGNALTKMQMEIVFPQLRESEDERIRKALVKQFGGCIKDDEFCHTGFTYAEITAWLEKQKEQKPDVNACKARARFIHNVLSGNDMKKMVELYNDEIPEGKNAVWAVIYTHKPKEQKPVELNLPKDFKQAVSEVLDAAKTSNLDVNVVADNLLKIAQKPAEWNKEDEMYLSQAIETLEHENYSILADKLKSLRPTTKK